ncbi:bifunctional hydroxymethylpyrimidine kinase/phosphomethylpyrimidine kinase [Marivibrio halodurans]|uniref:hydroxymethylpyrimidine kinase n=1 Tax=Marivibrio halodurans TaxID=2039722 RepID=A0A8J7S7M8_9PROT|nr:bifunctional hydroxymethylpyrimidine kinase/phosphomethylpyrimidine kinase [Marivibrio halodurans]MBP5858324.1 bifunctional hydroxymethylpyrimidine kinase/phosphomethylpyrimidine kinase [Marivibrio halodurans]
MSTPIALTVAGSDSGGGAGIQADLKTFSALGVYGCSVITALTAQNTREVQGVFDVSPSFVRAQMRAVFEDIAIDAVKIGMLGRADVIDAVRLDLKRYKPAWVVLDPVMVAKSGDRLLAKNAMKALIDGLVPLADIITPNLPEAAALLKLKEPITDPDAMVEAARRLLDFGPRAVLLKGGHLAGDSAADLLFTEEGGSEWLPGRRFNTRNTHGTGCTLSAAIAAGLAKGQTMGEAVKQAKAYIANAIATADTLDVGGGHGPVHHFHGLWHG